MDDLDQRLEQKAREIAAAALREGRVAELEDCLLAGGAATVDSDGRLVLASARMLDGMMPDGG